MFWHSKQLCKELYPNGSPYGNGTALFYEHCALAYTNRRGDPEVYLLHDVYFDYSDL